MNKEVDVFVDYSRIKRDVYIKLAYRYKFYPNLAADKNGNLFLLPHFIGKRTVKFRRLYFNDKKQLRLKQSTISLKQLKECAYRVEENYLFATYHI